MQQFLNLKFSTDHVAIMRKDWKLIDKILSGEKTIESRWYKNRIAPWDRIKKGDKVYFKNSGEKVTAKAGVSDVLQFNLDSIIDTQRIVETYGRNIALVNSDYTNWHKKKNYCILIFLKNPQPVKPFSINKSGFGASAAWMIVGDIETIKIK